MNKREKVLIVLTSISVFLLVYLIISSKKVHIAQLRSPIEEVTIKDNAPTMSLAQIESEYKQSLKAEVDKLSISLNSTNQEKINKESVDAIKSILMKQKVPEELKSLHVEIITAINKLEAYLNTGRPEYKILVNNLIEQNKQKYAWLR